MVWLQNPPGGEFHSFEEYEKYLNSLEPLKVKSYEDYLEKGHEWCWCLVGNVVEEHAVGTEKEIKKGTKHFSGGTKVYLAPIQWGDGYEKVIVIGIARGSRNYIEVIMSKKNIENFRIQKVYKPAIVKRMINSKNLWWGDSDDARKEILEYLET